MTIKESILADIKTAMKNKESDRLSALRFVHAAIKNKEIEIRPNEITDNDVISVLKKMAKQREDAIEQYQKAGRPELADQESQQLELLKTYLPEAMSPDKVKNIVIEVIESLGATGMQDMGKVMQAVMAKTQGTADNKLVSQFVREKLQ
jgi:hypothetical protein